MGSVLTAAKLRSNARIMQRRLAILRSDETKSVCGPEYKYTQMMNDIKIGKSIF